MEFMLPILEHIDPRLYPVVVNLIIFGYWIKKKDKSAPLPKWMPRIPLLLIIISFAMCTLFGWVFSSGEGVKSIVESVFVYGLSNGIMCAAFAMMSYDGVHAYTKKLQAEKAPAELSVEKIYILNQKSSKRDIQMKWILYGGTALVGSIIGALFASLAGGQDWFYSAMWAIWAGMVAAITARVIYHIVINDNSAETWAISIYALVASFGWLGAIFSATVGTDVLTFAVVIGAAMMAFGTRFINAPLSREAQMDWLKANARYKYIDDNPMMGDDEERPLCMVSEGVSFTANEAASAGYGELAAKAQEYLAQVYCLQVNQPAAEEE